MQYQLFGPRRLAALVLLATLCGCTRPATQTPATEPSPGPSAATALVTVNGQKLTQDDLAQWLKRNKVDGEKRLSAQETRNALGPVVRLEVLAQKASALGLDKDEGYQQKLRQKEAELAAFRREELARLFVARPRQPNDAATEQEARDYFEQNAARLQSRFHVQQLLKKSPSELDPLLAKIRGGTEFESVALAEFGKIAATGARPWDLGYLRWEQLPEPWRNTIETLKPGEVSDIIAGPGSRYWIIQLVDKKADPAVTFESERAALIETLSARKLQAARAQEEKELLDAARVVFAHEIGGGSTP